MAVTKSHGTPGHHLGTTAVGHRDVNCLWGLVSDLWTTCFCWLECNLCETDTAFGLLHHQPLAHLRPDLAVFCVVVCTPGQMYLSSHKLYMLRQMQGSFVWHVLSHRNDRWCWVSFFLYVLFTALLVTIAFITWGVIHCLLFSTANFIDLSPLSLFLDESG